MRRFERSESNPVRLEIYGSAVLHNDAVVIYGNMNNNAKNKLAINIRDQINKEDFTNADYNSVQTGVDTEVVVCNLRSELGGKTCR